MLEEPKAAGSDMLLTNRSQAASGDEIIEADSTSLPKRPRLGVNACTRKAPLFPPPTPSFHRSLEIDPDISLEAFACAGFLRPA